MSLSGFWASCGFGVLKWCFVPVAFRNLFTSLSDFSRSIILVSVKSSVLP